MNTLERAARKEKKEHPWASMSIARKIAKDHLMKHRKKNPCRSNSNVPLRQKKATTVSAGATVNVVRLYNTDVVTHDLQSGKVTLRTGGWVTKTTVTRMNQYAEQFGVPYQVNIRNRNAVVTVQGKSYPFDNEIIIQL
jgi:hypothetical protein